VESKIRENSDINQSIKLFLCFCFVVHILFPEMRRVQPPAVRTVGVCCWRETDPPSGVRLCAGRRGRCEAVPPTAGPCSEDPVPAAVQLTGGCPARVMLARGLRCQHCGCRSSASAGRRRTATEPHRMQRHKGPFWLETSLGSPKIIGAELPATAGQMLRRARLEPSGWLRPAAACRTSLRACLCP